MSLFGYVLNCIVNPQYSIGTALETLRSAWAEQHNHPCPPNVHVYNQAGVVDEKRPGTIRWYPKARYVSDITAIGFHTTAVPGGFGVAKYQIQPWLQVWDAAANHGILQQGRPLAEDYHTLVPWYEMTTPLPEARLKWARLQALRFRYMKLTYHSISSAAGELVINHPAWRVTWHGNAMNRYTWGHAFDDVWPEGKPVEQKRVDHERAVLERLYRYLRDIGCNPKYVEMHSQHKNKPHDPGMPYIEHVIAPFARDNGLEFRPLVHSGSGEPLELPWAGE